ncbi:MAG: rhomboid family intramembrane serine protease [Sciscionella sp.]
MSTTPAPTNDKRVATRVLPPHPKQAAVVIVAFTAVLYLVEAVNSALGDRLAHDGIRPRTLSGLWGILDAPLIHGSWEHLLHNTIPVLLFGFLALSVGLVPWISATVLIWLLSGVGVWLTGASATSVVGASGLAFGWLAFLLVRGFLTRSVAQILIAVVLFVYWGSVLFGLLPWQPSISWQAHVFGAVGGVLAALLTAKAGRYAPVTTPPGNLTS